jgi:hypothetical protein
MFFFLFPNDQWLILILEKKNRRTSLITQRHEVKKPKTNKNRLLGVFALLDRIFSKEIIFPSEAAKDFTKVLY